VKPPSIYQFIVVVKAASPRRPDLAATLPKLTDAITGIEFAGRNSFVYFQLAKSAMLLESTYVAAKTYHLLVGSGIQIRPSYGGTRISN
jgi:hypothetical protein